MTLIFRTLNFAAWALLLGFSNNFNVSYQLSLHNSDLSMSNSLNNSSLSICFTDKNKVKFNFYFFANLHVLLSRGVLGLNI